MGNSTILAGLDDDVLLDVLDVQVLLSLSHAAVYRRVAHGWLPAPRTRRPTRWRAGDLRNIIEPHVGRPRKGRKAH